MNEPTDLSESAAPTQEASQHRGYSQGKFAKKKGKKKRRWLRVLIIILCVIAALLVAAVAAYVILYKSGQKSMTSYDNVAVDFPQSNEKVLSQNNGKTVVYNGHTYTLNENIASILFIGVDKRQLTDTQQIGENGQGDCILLVAMDTVTGKTNIVSISRDAYAEVDLYSADGNYIGTDMTQLCLAYSYGDGRQTSCENMAKSVSRLLYGLPINYYFALDMDGIIEANDAVGGVTLTSISDLTLSDGTKLHKGDSVTLRGKNAERYIRSRDFEALDANVERMARQKQYVQAFASVVTQKSKEDLTVPVTLFQTLSPYMVTNLSVDTVTFLATCYLRNGASFDFLSIDADIQEVDGHAMYYLNEDSLYEAILTAFYTQVD